MNNFKFSSVQEVNHYVSDEKIQCLECLEYYANLGKHIRAHNMTISEYKEKYNIPMNVKLVGKKYRENRRKLYLI